jgi:hypothetical protein
MYDVNMIPLFTYAIKYFTFVLKIELFISKALGLGRFSSTFFHVFVMMILICVLLVLSFL